MQPRADRLSSDRPGTAGEDQEGGLAGVFGVLGVAEQPAAGAEHHPVVPPDQLGERLLVPAAGDDDVVVPVPGPRAPAAGQVVPTERGHALVAYLLSLQQAPLEGAMAGHSAEGATQ